MEWSNGHYFRRGQWPIPHNHLRERLPLRRGACRHCHQFGHSERMAYGHQQNARHDNLQLRDQPSKSNYLGRVCQLLHTEYDQTSDGGRGVVSDGRVTHESTDEHDPWLPGTLPTRIYTGFVLLVNGQETNVSWNALL